MYQNFKDSMFLESSGKQSLILSTVDCEWDSWRIGTCSKECGGGKRTNLREVKIEAANGGKNCSGGPTIIEDCNIEECPGMNFIKKLLPNQQFFYLKDTCHKLNLSSTNFDS